MATGCEVSASKNQKGHGIVSLSMEALNQGTGPTEATAVTREDSSGLLRLPLQSRASPCSSLQMPLKHSKWDNLSIYEHLIGLSFL